MPMFDEAGEVVGPDELDAMGKALRRARIRLEGDMASRNADDALHVRMIEDRRLLGTLAFLLAKLET